MKNRIPSCFKNKSHKVDYSKEFDAYYCSKCNVWLEQNCCDGLCEFCKDRPEEPV